MPIDAGQSHPSHQDNEHNLVELAQSGGIFSDEERRIIRDVLDVASGQSTRMVAKTTRARRVKATRACHPELPSVICPIIWSQDFPPAPMVRCVRLWG
jgi:uncharacterized membrane protein